EIEPRDHRTKHYFHKGELVHPDLDSMIIVRTIKCNGSSLRAKATEKIFIEPRNLYPNRTYVVAFGGHSSTKITAAERAAARPIIKSLLKRDPYFNKIIRRDFNEWFRTDSYSHKLIKVSQDSLQLHLQRVVQQRFPQYRVQYPDSKSDT